MSESSFCVDCGRSTDHTRITDSLFLNAGLIVGNNGTVHLHNAVVMPLGQERLLPSIKRQSIQSMHVARRKIFTNNKRRWFTGAAALGVGTVIVRFLDQREDTP